MKTGIDWRAIDKNHVWHPFTSLKDTIVPPLIVRGEGIYLITEDGRKIIDAVSSWWVNIHGHANLKLAEAIYKQAKELEHVIFAGFTHPAAIQLTNNLLSIFPSNQSRIFFSDNGSTAVEVAIKMAMQYWFNRKITKKRIVALNGAYHGDTFGAMSVGERGAFTAPFNSYLFDVTFIDVPHKENYDKVLATFKSIVNSGEVAAFIYEPLVQGASGMIMYKPEYLNKLLEIAHQHDVVCIADEVFTGFGRTGKLFASEYMDEQPDILCVSKGITGGMMPLGVTSCSKEIENAFQSAESDKTFFHGHSYTANPIACSAANASFELLMSKSCQDSIQQISEAHQEFVSKIGGHHRVTEARFRGTILAIELNSTQLTSYFNDLKKEIYNFFLSRNILIRPLGNIFYVLPPYIITRNELQLIYETIEEFLNSNES